MEFYVHPAGTMLRLKHLALEAGDHVNRTRQGWRTRGFFRFLLVANAKAVELPTCLITASTIEETVMENPGKLRDEHRGQPAPHLGQDHFEKSQLERAVPVDTGPTHHAIEPARIAIEAGDNISPIPATLGNIYMPTEPEVASAEADLEGETNVVRAG